MDKPLTKPAVVTIYSTKGGSLKSSLTLNLARIAALHNIKVCVVGLDMQCDISMMLGFNLDGLADMSLKNAMEELSSYYSLNDLVLSNPPNIFDIIEHTDIPTLDYIPEFPTLASLNEQMGQMADPANWLSANVAMPLKKNYDLIIFDCSPNWNRLVSGALFSTDLLISPLECKINNFRNYPIMKANLDVFRKKK